MMYENKLLLEEKTLSLFQPDTLLFDEFRQTVRPATFLRAEKRLMLAVLEDAVTCFVKYHTARDRKNRRLFDEAREWVLERDNDWPFAFENICDVLGLNSSYLRQGLLESRGRTMRKNPKTDHRDDTFIRYLRRLGRPRREVFDSRPGAASREGESGGRL